jgi:hypothetical protein
MKSEQFSKILNNSVLFVLCVVVALVAFILVYAAVYKIVEHYTKPSLTEFFQEIVEDEEPVLLDLALERIQIHNKALLLANSTTYDKLVELVYHECRSTTCSPYEQTLILEVAYNRTSRGHLGADSVVSTINKPYQFSYLNNVPNNSMSPQPTTLGDYKSLVAIQSLVASVMSSYNYNNEGVNKYELTSTGAIMYYNPDKVTTPPNWVDPKCLIDTGNTLHKFYTCYKLK